MARTTRCLLALIPGLAFPAAVHAVTPVIEAGYTHNLGLTAAGRVYGWGANDGGTLGNGTGASSSIPVRASGLDNVIAVSASRFSSYAVRADGSLWYWGAGFGGPDLCYFNVFGTVSSSPCTRTPRAVPGFASAASVSAGALHLLVARTDGTVLSQGSNGVGQLGTGTTSAVNGVATVGGLTGVRKVAAGENFSLALRSDGTVWAWGTHGRGELGVGSASATCQDSDPYGGGTAARPCATSPARITALANVVDIAAGGRFALALRADGTVWSWGSNRYGQLGDGTTSNRTTAAPVAGLSSIARIAAGFGHALALRGDGTLFAWGLNNHAQLGFTASPSTCGNNVSGCARIATAVPARAGAVDVVAGAVHSIAVRPDGSLEAFGNGDSGQLGTGTVLRAIPPTQWDPDQFGLNAIAEGSGGSLGRVSTGGLNLDALDDGLAFAPQAIGQVSAPISARLTNVAPQPLQVTGVTVPGDFRASHTCTAALGVLQSCDIEVRHAPSVAGAREGLLQVATNAPGGGTVELPLTGYGVGAAGINYTSLWWNPAEPGWGVNLNHQGSVVFATLFTYAADGEGLWLVASGLAQQPDGSFGGTLYRTTGTALHLAWAPVAVLTVGTMNVRFSRPDVGVLTYTFDGVAVTKSIRRQAFSSPVPDCVPTTASRDAETNYQDLWWNSSESGWGLNLTHQGTTIFATLFNYAVSGRGIWLVASGLTRQPDGRYSGPLYHTRGPAFNASPWSPATVTEVGTMTLQFATTGTASLAYTYFGTSVAKTIRRQTFGTSQPLCR